MPQNAGKHVLESFKFQTPVAGHVAQQHTMLPTQAQFTSAAYSVQIRHLLHFLMTTLFHTTNQCTKCDITKRLCLELSQLEFKNVFNPLCLSFAEKAIFYQKAIFPRLGTKMYNILVDLFQLGGLLPHFRPCDNTLGNSSFQIFK